MAAEFLGREDTTIGKNVFWPAPNIESGLVRIDCFEDAQGQRPQARSYLNHAVVAL